MNSPDARVYVAGHRGMVGSAVWRALEAAGYSDLVGWSSSEVDLTNRDAAMDAVGSARPDVVVVAAARPPPTTGPEVCMARRLTFAASVATMLLRAARQS